MLPASVGNLKEQFAKLSCMYHTSFKLFTVAVGSS